MVKDKPSVYYLTFFGLIILLCIPFTGCSIGPAFWQNPHYIYEDGALLVDGSDQPIEVINSPDAVNVSYTALLRFIREDPTDQIQYVSRGSDSGQRAFVCSDFAEEVHNNAEAAGIRAGYVSIDWEDGNIGHAINAFETTDEGLVYIDCTGKSVYSQIEEGDSLAMPHSWDKVAYVEIGKKYGVIDLDYAQSSLYTFFEEYDQKWQEFRDRLAAYNAEVKQYNQEITRKVYRQGSAELASIQAWETQLEAQEKELNALSSEIGDSRFKPLGIVRSFNVHW